MSTVKIINNCQNTILIISIGPGQDFSLDQSILPSPNNLLFIQPIAASPTSVYHYNIEGKSQPFTLSGIPLPPDNPTLSGPINVSIGDGQG